MGVATMLEKLKLMLLKLSFIPTKSDEANMKELLLSRDTLEIGAQYAVMQEDIPGFERYMAQLQTYYHDHQGDLPDSPFQYQLLGLNLLCLLSQNRVAEFHTELERLPAKEVQNNVYIKHPVSLEQYIMEGSYNKVLLAKGNVPAESYKYFIDILMTTVRSEIASCLEKAYADISCSDAARMLSISAGDINAYAAERKWQYLEEGFSLGERIQRMRSRGCRVCSWPTWRSPTPERWSRLCSLPSGQVLPG